MTLLESIGTAFCAYDDGDYQTCFEILHSLPRPNNYQLTYLAQYVVSSYKSQQVFYCYSILENLFACDNEDLKKEIGIFAAREIFFRIGPGDLYYWVKLKLSQMSSSSTDFILLTLESLRFVQIGIIDKQSLQLLFKTQEGFDVATIELIKALAKTVKEIGVVDYLNRMKDKVDNSEHLVFNELINYWEKMGTGTTWQ